MRQENKFSTIQTGQRQRPLMMQLALASGALAQPSLLKGNNFTDEFWQREDGQNARASMEKVVEGLRRYQLHPYMRKPQRESIIWSDGESRIIWVTSTGKKKQKTHRSIFIIPSMINGPEILDIIPEKRSLVRWLASQGFDVFLFEWGHMQDDEELFTIDSAVGDKLSRGIKWLKSEIDTPLFGMGYCMGGLFLAASEILNPDAFDGLIFIATPWDFKAGAKGSFAEAITAWAPDGLRRVGHLNYLPNEWLQMIFAGVEPAQVARKFSALADMKEGSLDEMIFIAVEDWVNGGDNLPAGIVQQAVKNWYQDNKVVSGEWVIKRKKIDARKIKKPSLVIVPAKDKIVPPASARPLSRQIKNADILIPECGHISMMVGTRAEKEVWKPIRDWISGSIH
jgi:polyhydroxyalkanoate synthase